MSGLWADYERIMSGWIPKEDRYVDVEGIHKRKGEGKISRLCADYEKIMDVLWAGGDTTENRHVDVDGIALRTEKEKEDPILSGLWTDYNIFWTDRYTQRKSARWRWWNCSEKGEGKNRELISRTREILIWIPRQSMSRRPCVKMQGSIFDWKKIQTITHQTTAASRLQENMKSVRAAYEQLVNWEPWTNADRNAIDVDCYNKITPIC